ncbi:MAG: homocysteine S-methyltransferase family protein [Clostridiales bacterium]|nr:homocysteine S-methyltransferase family protein [Clostridiales bacterium]
MTKQAFRELLTGKIICLDGATGSNLQKRGMPNCVCPELWITEHEDILIALQREYVEAGSDIIYAPTFSGNRIKMREYGLADRLDEINTKLVMLSREAAGGKAYVAGDITMTGAQLEPLGDLTFAELCDVYREQIAIIAKAGADLIVVETMMSLQETRAAVLAAREVCPDLPLMATLSFTASGNTLYGTSAESAVIVLQSLGVDAVGLNCSVGPDQMIDVVRRMKKVASVPLIAKPNAGLPQIGADGQTVYDMDADAFAAYMMDVADAGADLVGGCCGTTPAYIACLKTGLSESGRMIRDTAGDRESAETCESVTQGTSVGQNESGRQSAFAGQSESATQGTSVGRSESGRQVTSDRQSESATQDIPVGQNESGSARLLYLANDRQVYAFRDGQILELGDGIDFRSDDELREEYAEDVFDTAQDLAFDLQDDGADALLFCAAGLEEEADILLAAVSEVTQIVRMPVVIASDCPETVRRVLTGYAGTAAVMPISENPSVCEEIEKITKLYGAALLTLDKKIRYC